MGKDAALVISLQQALYSSVPSQGGLGGTPRLNCGGQVTAQRYRNENNPKTFVLEHAQGV
jgi:hypothetical protein